MTYHASQSGRRFVLPEQNALEAALVKKATIYAAKSLLQICAHLTKQERLPVFQSNLPEDIDDEKRIIQILKMLKGKDMPSAH